MSAIVYEHEYLLVPDRESFAEKLEAAAAEIREHGTAMIPLGGTVVAHVFLIKNDEGEDPHVWIQA